MGNPLKGEKTIEVQGQVYTLHLGINAMCEMEGAASTPQTRVTFQQIAQRAVNEELTAMRLLFWGLLRKHHPKMTIGDAGDLIEQINQSENAADLMAQLTSSGQPDPADVEALGGRPQKAPARKQRVGGTTTRSTGLRAVQE